MNLVLTSKKLTVYLSTIKYTYTLLIISPCRKPIYYKNKSVFDTYQVRSDIHCAFFNFLNDVSDMLVAVMLDDVRSD